MTINIYSAYTGSFLGALSAFFWALASLKGQKRETARQSTDSNRKWNRTAAAFASAASVAQAVAIYFSIPGA